MSEAAISNGVVPVTGSAVPAAAGPAPGDWRFETILERIRSFAGQPAVAKSLPAIGALTLAAVAILAWLMLSTPPARTLYGNLGDADKASIAQALDAAGIPYELEAGTGAISVAQTDYHQAKMLLASEGLPHSAPDGETVIEKLPLGASRAVESERLRAAREMDLARTIEAIDAVESARVHLALEAPSAFVRDRASRAASVMLRMANGRVLSDTQIQAIVHLVASSVPGLSPDAVSIVDQSGRLLSSGSGDGFGGIASSQIAVQAKVEERYRESLRALLTPIVGAGNFIAEVNAELDFSENQSTREAYPSDAAQLSHEERAWTRDRTDDRAVGIPGTLSNEAPTATKVAAAPGAKLDPKTPGSSDNGEATKSSENYTRDYAVGRVVSVTKQPTGGINRLSVAVALRNPADGKPRSAKELKEIEALVKGAIGFDAARGDVVAISARTFAPVEDIQPAWWQAGWVALVARNVSAIAIAALIVFGLGWPILKRRGAIVPARSSVRGAKASTSAAQGAASLSPQQAQVDQVDTMLKMIEAAPSYETRAVLIRDFVKQDPARAALAVRELLRSDGGDGADHG